MHVASNPMSTNQLCEALPQVAGEAVVASGRVAVTRTNAVATTSIVDVSNATSSGVVAAVTGSTLATVAGEESPATSTSTTSTSLVAPPQGSTACHANSVEEQYCATKEIY